MLTGDPDQSFEHAYQQFVLDCERTSQPVRDIDFGTALDELANSYEVMHRARTAPSPRGAAPGGQSRPIGERRVGHHIRGARLSDAGRTTR